MKKVLLTFFVALISLSASAQRKGDFAVGLRGGPTMTKIEFLGIKENYTRWGAGAFVQYNLTDHFLLLIRNHSKRVQITSYDDIGLVLREVKQLLIFFVFPI